MKKFAYLLLFLFFLIVIVYLSSSVGKGTKTNGEKTDDLMLPDLKVSKPRELTIIEADGKKLLRFSTTTFNNGEGELRVLGENNANDSTTKATQIISQKNNKQQRKEIGKFVFHPDHDHWHIEKFTQFQIWSLKENNKPDKLITTTEKMSFCLWDEKKINESFMNQRTFTGECNNHEQGISAGWEDTYSSDLPGQELDISSIGDGRYLVKTTINPDRKITESNYDNNSETILIDIKGNQVNLI